MKSYIYNLLFTKTYKCWNEITNGVTMQSWHETSSIKCQIQPTISKKEIKYQSLKEDYINS